MEACEPEATTYLKRLLNRPFRIHTTDTRIFVGEFKCTDSECNIILARTFEYRHPSKTKVQSAAQLAASSPSNATDSLKVNMTSRFLGLVVVPGQHITKIEVEEKIPVDPVVTPTTSNMKDESTLARIGGT